MKSKKYTPKTTETILKKVAGLSIEELHEMRWNVAVEYLVKARGERRADALLRSPRFWNWYLRLWEIQDKMIMAKMQELRYDTCNSAWYEDQQRSTWLQTKWVYNATAAELKAVINL